MDWSNIISIIAALAFTVGVPIALRSRKKEGPKNVAKLVEHLEQMGVKASLVEDDIAGKLGVKRSFAQRSEGLIKIAGRQMDYINVTSVTSQYGVTYYLEYLVTSPEYGGARRRGKTRMVGKKAPGSRGRVTDIEWKGDRYLSPQLNFDYKLKARLLSTELDKIKNSILIYPEPKHNLVRIRTHYLLPSSDLLKAIEIIAGHIKSGW